MKRYIVFGFLLLLVFLLASCDSDALSTSLTTEPGLYVRWNPDGRMEKHRNLEEARSALLSSWAGGEVVEVLQDQSVVPVSGTTVPSCDPPPNLPMLRATDKYYQFDGRFFSDTQGAWQAVYLNIGGGLFQELRRCEVIASGQIPAWNPTLMGLSADFPPNQEYYVWNNQAFVTLKEAKKAMGLTWYFGSEIIRPYKRGYEVSETIENPGWMKYVIIGVLGIVLLIVVAGLREGKVVGGKVIGKAIDRLPDDKKKAVKKVAKAGVASTMEVLSWIIVIVFTVIGAFIANRLTQSIQGWFVFGVFFVIVLLLWVITTSILRTVNRRAKPTVLRSSGGRDVRIERN